MPVGSDESETHRQAILTKEQTRRLVTIRVVETLAYIARKFADAATEIASKAADEHFGGDAQQQRGAPEIRRAATTQY